MMNKIRNHLAAAALVIAVLYVLPRLLQQRTELRQSGGEARIVGDHFSIDLPPGWDVSKTEHGWIAEYGKGRSSSLMVASFGKWPAMSDDQIEEADSEKMSKMISMYGGATANAIACRRGVPIGGHLGVVCSGRTPIVLCGEIQGGRCVRDRINTAYLWNHYAVTVGLQTYMLMSEEVESETQALTQIARSTASFEIHD